MARTSRSIVSGLFRDRGQAERAADELRRSGFEDDQVRVESEHSDAPEVSSQDDSEPGLGGGIITGLLLGAIIGGALGAILAGAIPGIGAVITADAVTATIVGAVAGAIVGALLGAIAARSRRQEARQRAAASHRARRAVVSVSTTERVGEARGILQRFGARDVDVYDDPEHYDELATPDETAAQPEPEPAPAATGAIGEEETRRINLAEEELVANKETRDLGSVHVRTEQEEKTGRIDVEAHRDEVSVEHIPVGEVVDQRREPWDEDGALVVPVYEEQLVVVKRLVMREKVRIRRSDTTETRHIEEPLRRDRLVVEDPDGTGAVREHYATDQGPEELVADNWNGEESPTDRG